MIEQINNQKEKMPARGKFKPQHNAIYYFLLSELVEQYETNEELDNFSNETYEKIKNLDEVTQGLIHEIIYDRENLLLKILSECPYISININNQNKGAK